MQDYSKQKALFIFTKVYTLDKVIYVSTLTELPLGDKDYVLTEIILLSDKVNDDELVGGKLGSIVIQKPKRIYSRDV